MNSILFLVADFFIQRSEKDGYKLPHKKLQKLVYYSQARSMVFFGKRLFAEEIQAWINGPVTPKLYHKFKCFGYGDVEPLNIFKKGMIGEKQENLLEDVYNIYGALSADELSWLTHKEDPRRKAREGLEDYQRSENVIKVSDMEIFYMKKLKKQ